MTTQCNVERKLFGTDGIRGKANHYPMTVDIAMALGRAVTSYFQNKDSRKRPLIIIGKDTRLSCYMFELAFSAGVCSQGGLAIFTGPLPTPGVAFVTQSMRADAGIMISASHNPFHDNGIKIFDRNGHKLPDEVELELEKLIENPELIEDNEHHEVGRARRLDEVMGRYIVHVKSCFDSEYNLEGMKLVVDCANGAGYKLGPMVFEELGAEVIPMGVNPNGKNINNKSGALHPQECAKKVIEEGADLGICFDGDGDRLVVVDEKGNIVEGDKIIGVLAKFLKDKGVLEKGSEVVGTTMSNLGLENFLKTQELKLGRTQVGDRYIMEKMKNGQALFGGENSGHLIFYQFATTGDGILAGLKVIECIKFYNKKMSELASEVELYPQVLKNVKVKDKIPFSDINGLSEELAKVENELGKQGRVLLRYSGTESLARVMIEGKDKELVERSCQHLADIIGKSIGV